MVLTEDGSVLVPEFGGRLLLPEFGPISTHKFAMKHVSVALLRTKHAIFHKSSSATSPRIKGCAVKDKLGKLDNPQGTELRSAPEFSVSTSCREVDRCWWCINYISD